jgi:LysM repeat protein
METISSRENSNFMPVIGIVAGVLALILAAVALVKVSGVRKDLDAQAEKVARIESIEANVSSLSMDVSKVSGNVTKLTSQTQDAVNSIGTMIGDLRTEVTKIQETMKAKAPAAKAAKGEVVAGPGEYIVKAGDTGMKISKANGVSLADLQAVNPGVNWNKLAKGQKIKLPAKK